jgi:hypothetical protein
MGFRTAKNISPVKAQLISYLSTHKQPVTAYQVEKDTGFNATTVRWHLNYLSKQGVVDCIKAKWPDHHKMREQFRVSKNLEDLITLDNGTKIQVLNGGIITQGCPYYLSKQCACNQILFGPKCRLWVEQRENLPKHINNYVSKLAKVFNAEVSAKCVKCNSTSKAVIEITLK